VLDVDMHEAEVIVLEGALAFGGLCRYLSARVTGVVRAFGWICSIAQTSLCRAWIRRSNR
jgi:hypothetical protein